MVDTVVIGNLYPELQSFFTYRLGIEVASASIMIQKLTEMCKADSTPVAKVKELLSGIGRMFTYRDYNDSAIKALNELRGTNFLPVKLATGETELQCAGDKFAILGHARYGEAFKAKVPLLDFSLEESKSLHSLLERLGMSGRYLSVMVKEESRVGTDAIENAVMSKVFRDKAYALFW